MVLGPSSIDHRAGRQRLRKAATTTKRRRGERRRRVDDASPLLPARLERARGPQRHNVGIPKGSAPLLRFIRASAHAHGTRGVRCLALVRAARKRPRVCVFPGSGFPSVGLSSAPGRSAGSSASNTRGEWYCSTSSPLRQRGLGRSPASCRYRSPSGLPRQRKRSRTDVRRVATLYAPKFPSAERVVRTGRFS